MKIYNPKLNIEEISNIPSPLSLKFEGIEKKIMESFIHKIPTNKSFLLKTSSCPSCENISDTKCEC